MEQTLEARILAVDFGEKRIGLAVTDPLNIFAYPLVTLQNNKDLWKELEKIIENYNVKKIILGNPIKENGQESKIFPLILKFKNELEKKFNIPVELVDERYTSSIAQKRIVETVKSKKKRKEKGLLDRNSAAVLLEDYLKLFSNKTN
ncbi:MAG: Holliday junction resolvase RuvX [Melioribacter sp.]|nr:Holliday junction resolvase RuvX [Melioribacter sp.]